MASFDSESRPCYYASKCEREKGRASSSIRVPPSYFRDNGVVRKTRSAPHDHSSVAEGAMNPPSHADDPSSGANLGERYPRSSRISRRGVFLSGKETRRTPRRTVPKRSSRSVESRCGDPMNDELHRRRAANRTIRDFSFPSASLRCRSPPTSRVSRRRSARCERAASGRCYGCACRHSK